MRQSEKRETTDRENKKIQVKEKNRGKNIKNNRRKEIQGQKSKKV